MVVVACCSGVIATSLPEAHEAPITPHMQSTVVDIKGAPVTPAVEDGDT